MNGYIQGSTSVAEVGFGPNTCGYVWDWSVSTKSKFAEARHKRSPSRYKDALVILQDSLSGLKQMFVQKIGCLDLLPAGRLKIFICRFRKLSSDDGAR